jgi:hypothetical protein
MRARRYPRRKADIHVPVPAATEYGIGPVVLGLPCVIGAAGVNRQRVLPMSAEEQQMLQHSAVILDQAYRSLTASGTTAGNETANPRLTATGDMTRAGVGAVHATGSALDAVRMERITRYPPSTERGSALPDGESQRLSQLDLMARLRW